MIRFTPYALYTFDYVNHRGERGTRKVMFLQFHYGVVEPYYPVPTLLFYGHDLDKEEYRSFDALKMENIQCLKR